LLANTTRLKVGTGIVNVYGRDAMTTAEARRTLSELFPDRFLLGLGVSNEQINTMRKAPWFTPVTKMSAYLRDLGETHLASVEPATFAPIYVAAHGPKLQQLAAGQADGIMTWAMPAQHTEHARKVVGPRAVITAQMPCLVSSDAKEARAVGRDYLSLWLGLPWYCKAWVDAGFSEKDVSDGGSDRLIDAVVPWGDAAVIANRIRGFHRAGADRVIIEPLRTGKPVGPTNAIVGKKTVMADWDSLAGIAGAVFHTNENRRHV
jgi:probable F420-dependent oxidoreductase